MGDERAGKTTLAKAIKRTWDEHLSSLEEIAMDSIDICERTAGMTICKTTIPSMGPTVVCDFAGQELFHHTHNMFFDESNSLCIMVVSGLLRKNEMFGQCRRWAAFLTAASSAGAIPVVTVVVSRRDACSNIFQVEAMTQGVVTELKGMFKSVLNIQERYFILDCRKSQSPEMVKFREFLGELKEQKLEVCINHTIEFLIQQLYVLLLNLCSCMHANEEIRTTLCFRLSESILDLLSLSLKVCYLV
jgi:GTPase SAR1 family protein